ncbi:MAG: linear amide C-N hydrolase [Acidobacteria bacterium]|nr:linear amide C-N hydrolase [Acidobacteriota bacterium]
MKKLILALLLMVLFLIKYPLATLESAVKVSNYPVLEMDFYGSNALLPQNAAQVHKLIERFYPAAVQKPADINCSLIAVHNPSSGTVYGRNFDWYNTIPIVFRVHRQPGRYASISMVDGSYLSVTGSLSLLDRINMMGGYISPFDGMNEKGLFIAIAMINKAQVPIDPKKETLTSVQMVRKILDTAATLDEALGICNQYNIDFFPGPHLHFLIGDAEGNGAVVEFTPDGVQIYRRDNIIFATNFVMAPGNPENFSGKCWRFDKLSATFADGVKPDFNESNMMNLLDNVKQTLNKGGTEWSAVYQSNGNLTVCFGKDYSQPYHFKLEK